MFVEKKMYSHICEQCKIEFQSKYQNSKFCSPSCSFESRKGKKRPNHGKKVSKALKKYYKTAIFKIEKISRYNKIAEKRKTRLSQEELNLLKLYLQEGYIRDLNILINHIKTNKSIKAIKNAFNDFPELLELYNTCVKALPWHIQRYSIEEWLIIKAYIINSNRKVLKNKYKIGESSFYRIRKRIPECQAQKYVNDKETEIERLVRFILQDNNISFEREKRINNGKWVADFAIGINLIEVNGDYWHGNNRIFSEKKLRKVQLRNKLNDIAKKEWILNNGYNLLVLWEMDIYNDIDKIKNLINEYTKINTKGICMESF